MGISTPLRLLQRTLSIKWSNFGAVSSYTKVYNFVKVYG